MNLQKVLTGFNLSNMNNEELNELLNIKNNLLYKNNYSDFILLYTSNIIINELINEKFINGKSSYKLAIDDLIKIGSNYFDYSEIYKEITQNKINIEYGFINRIECGENECNIYYNTANQSEKIIKIDNVSYMPYKTSKYIVENEKIVNIQNFLMKSAQNVNGKYNCDYYYHYRNIYFENLDKYKVKTFENVDNCKMLPDDIDKKLIIDEYFELHFIENNNGRYKLSSIKL